MKEFLNIHTFLLRQRNRGIVLVLMQYQCIFFCISPLPSLVFSKNLLFFQKPFIFKYSLAFIIYYSQDYIVFHWNAICITERRKILRQGHNNWNSEFYSVFRCEFSKFYYRHPFSGRPEVHQQVYRSTICNSFFMVMMLLIWSCVYFKLTM